MGAIVARAPLRVALGGGGTDLPSYYREHGGFVVSTAIDRYVHMVVSADFQHALPPEAPGVGGGRRPVARCATRSCARCSPATGTARRWSWRRWRTRRPAPASARRAPTPSARSRRCAPRRGRTPARPELAEAACEIEIDVLGAERRQAGPVRGRVRRRARLHLPPRRLGRRPRAGPARPRGAGAPRASSSSSSPAASAPPRTCCPGQVSGTASGDASVRRALDRLHELGRADLRGARGRRPRRASAS